MRDNTPQQLKPIGSSASAEIQCPDFAEFVKNSTPDSSLFEQIAHCFADRLEDFARFYCRDESMGKDAFQDAMIAAMKYLDTYRGDSPIEPWLRRIVASACSRLRRGKKNDPTLNIPFDENKETIGSNQPTPDQELRLLLAEKLELLRSEIERLKEPDRSLLLLHDVHEKPIAELVDQFQLTTEAVKSRLKRSRATVRERLLSID